MNNDLIERIETALYIANDKELISIEEIVKTLEILKESRVD